MSLFTDLKEILTPYAQRIKGLAAIDNEIKADLGYLYPGEYDVVSGLYIDYASSTLKAIPASYDYSECVICIAAEAGKTYKVVKKTKTIMRVGVGASDSLGDGDALKNIVRHTRQADGDTPLYVTTDADNTYIYIQLYTGDASTDYKNISANIASLTVSEEFSQELTELKNEVANITPGLSEDAKRALLDCIAHIGIWSDEPGAYYYNALEAALNGTPLETWTYEWNYTDGLPEANGMSKTIAGESSSEITSNGLLMQAEDASGMKVQYAYYDVDSTKEYVKGIYEFVFTINTFGSYNTAPYGNGVQIWLGMGQRNGNPVNCAELTFNQGGVLHFTTVNGSGTWETIDSTPFVTGREYSIRCEQTLTETKVYVDGTLVGTIPASSHREALSSQVFLIRRCTSVTVKRFRFKLSEA